LIELRKSVTEFPKKNFSFNYLSLFILALKDRALIYINALGSCYVETPLVRRVMKDKIWYENIRQRNVFRRFGKPEKVLGPAIFLVSDASSLITGSLILPDVA